MQPITAPGTAPGRTDLPPGRWIWHLSGVATIAVGVVVVAFAGIRPGTFDNGFNQTAAPARTVVVDGTVTSLNINSYGAPIQVTRGPVSQVTVVESISYDKRSAPPKVTERLSGGALTLDAPSCQNGSCSVGFAVTVPESSPAGATANVTASAGAGAPANVTASPRAAAQANVTASPRSSSPASVTVKATSESGEVDVSDVAAADIHSGGGDVNATAIAGALTVTSASGSITAVGAGSAILDSGGGSVTVSGVHGPLSVTSASGGIDAQEIGSAVLDSGGGPVSATAVAGTLTVNTASGTIDIDGAQGANLHSGGGDIVARSIDGPLSATTDSGSLQVDGLTGPLSADTGGGSVNASALTSATARVGTDSGAVWMSFTTAPRSVQVTTGGGDAVLMLPGGPYDMNADPAGGTQQVSVPVSPAASSTISVSTDGGQLQVKPSPAGS